VAESADPVAPGIDHEEIAHLAYSYWEARSFSDGRKRIGIVLRKN
jgi:hypothetical protein